MEGRSMEGTDFKITKQLKPLTTIVNQRHGQTIDDHIIKEYLSQAMSLLSQKMFAI